MKEQLNTLPPIMPTPREQRRARRKTGHDATMSIDPTNADDATLEATNGPSRVSSYKCVSYLKFGAAVQASK